MTVFLFWNLNRRELQDPVASLAEEHSADIVVLSECGASRAEMLRSLNRRRPDFFVAEANCPRIEIFTRFSPQFTEAVSESPSRSIWGIRLPGQLPIILAAVHLPSKLYFSDASQSAELGQLAQEVRNAEVRVGHSNTLVVGDFNVNPFESGMISTAGMHAVMSRKVASALTRTVQGQDYSFFYNPMWSLMGDAGGKPAGTHYYSRAEHVTYFWNTFDQVLLRPELAARLGHNSPAIIVTCASGSLIAPNGLPDSVHFSDHLPIVCEVDLREPR